MNLIDEYHCIKNNFSSCFKIELALDVDKFKMYFWLEYNTLESQSLT